MLVFIVQLTPLILSVLYCQNWTQVQYLQYVNVYIVTFRFWIA